MHKRKNEKGFAVIDRGILEWGWYSEPNTSRVFMHLIITANHAPHSYMGITIERGQAVTGYPALAKTLGLSERNIRTAFKNLKSTGEITTKTTRRFSVVTLCNYELYNKSKLASDSLPTVSRQSSDSQVTPPNKKKKKEKNNTTMRYPSLEELREYAHDKGLKNLDCEYFMKYFTESEWIDSKGNRVLNWKLKALTWNKMNVGGNSNNSRQGTVNGAVL